MNSGIVESEFELQSRYYVHFWTNTLGKGMNAQIGHDIKIWQGALAIVIGNFILAAYGGLLA